MILKLFMLFYSEDAIIFPESAEELQNGINLLFRYCSRWKLKLNTDKSQVIIFKRGRKSSKKSSHGDMELKATSNIDNLDLRFSVICSFHQAQHKLASQAKKAAFIIHKRLNDHPYLTPRHTMEMYDIVITRCCVTHPRCWDFMMPLILSECNSSFVKLYWE